MAFTHLHVHTEFSLLDGSNKIKEYVARVKELGMNSAAITDHGVMFGVIDFYKAAKAAGINPILGCEVYVAPNSRFDREAAYGEDRYYHLVLLAENNEGYQNLMKIVSKGFVDGYYYKPRVDMEVLQQYHSGIIALSACLAGEVQRYLVKGLYDEAKKVAEKYENCFGKGNFFLELQDHGIPEQQMVNPQLVRMSQETGIELVATNDVHYTYAEDAEAHDILLCIQTGKKLSDENRMRYEGGQYYVKSEEEMRKLFSFASQAIVNTHPHADHIGGFAELIKEITVDELWLCFPAEETVHCANAIKAAERAGVTVRMFGDGDTLTLGTATMQVWMLDKPEYTRLNDRSAQIMLTFGQRKILFSADLEQKGQNGLIEKVGAEMLKADVLKYPHHGLQALTPEYRAAVSPELAIVTCNQRETDGKKYIRRTALDTVWTVPGFIHLTTDGEMWVCDRIVSDVKY